jgi:alpha-L-rhamnosidase
MWEHWDGIDEEGNMWSTKMNSFNHYSYGAVADWIYEVAAGIGQEKSSAGYEMPVIAPHPDKRLGWLEASLETKHGQIHSKWTHTLEGSTKYEISVPVKSKIVIGEKQYTVDKGTYVFFE